MKWEPFSGIPVFSLCFRIKVHATTMAITPNTPRATPIPMPAFAPVLRPPELAAFDDVAEPVGAVLVADAVVPVPAPVPVLEEEEELVVVDGAKLYPLSWIPYTLAPWAVMVL
jgi:hypothetical protein